VRVEVDPIRRSREGTMTVKKQDRAAWQAGMRAETTDQRVGGGNRAGMSLTLAPGLGGTRLHIETDLAILGRIGEFGQPVIKKKADAFLDEFARNLGAALAA